MHLQILVHGLGVVEVSEEGIDTVKGAGGGVVVSGPLVHPSAYGGGEGALHEKQAAVAANWREPSAGLAAIEDGGSLVLSRARARKACSGGAGGHEVT